MIELSLRSTSLSKLSYSPFEILFGRHMHIGEATDVVDTTIFDGDVGCYIRTLQRELQMLHNQVRERKLEIKAEESSAYDKRNKVSPPKWYVGQTVLLEHEKVKKNSNVVLTKHPFRGPFYIGEIVKGDKNIGPSYRLIDVKTGKTHRYLISSDRLKNYDGRRIDMVNRVPPIINDRVNYTQHFGGADITPPDDATNELNEDKVQAEADTQMEPALRILRQRTRNKQIEYFVEFCDNSKYWCSDVTPELLRQYRLKQQERRSKANRRRKQRTRQ